MRPCWLISPSFSTKNKDLELVRKFNSIIKNPCIPAGSAFQTGAKTTQSLGGVGRYCWKAILVICCLHSKAIHLLKLRASEKLKKKNGKQGSLQKFEEQSPCFFSATTTFTTVHAALSASSGFKMTRNRLWQPSGHQSSFLHSIRDEGYKGAA